MSRQRISILFMALSIAVIAAFQVFWLHANYIESKKVFTIHSNILFRETIFKLQASKLHLDTNIHIRHIQDKAGVISMTNVLQKEISDSLPDTSRRGSSIIVSINENQHRSKTDSPVNYVLKMPAQNIKFRYGRGDSIPAKRMSLERVYDFLVGVDSLQDSLSIKEIQTHYRQALLTEGFNIPFHITASNHNTSPDTGPEDPADNKVTVGFARPVTFQLEVDNISWYVMKRMGAQIFFSLVLVGLTIFSFLLLYRNWQRQKNLTTLKNDFISNITHELKTPIATVSVAIEALKNFNALEDPVRTREYLDISGNELNRLSLLVDKVLKLSMFEKEQVELKNESFNLELLINEVIASMRLQFENYDAKLSFAISGKSFHVKADKLHITSVIYNLLDNALKYSKTNPSINIALREEPQQLVLSVTDNGIGISSEYLDKIFDKFFRIPAGNKHNVKGYGLGLSYVAYVIQRQGGSVHVDSKEGIGSCFTIKIPKEDEQV